MPQLITKDDTGQDVTTLIVVAESIGKQHKHVMRDITAPRFV